MLWLDVGFGCCFGFSRLMLFWLWLLFVICVWFAGLGVWFSVVCCWVLGFGFRGVGCVAIDSLVGSGCFVWITVLGLADWGGGVCCFGGWFKSAFLCVCQCLANWWFAELVGLGLC